MKRFHWNFVDPIRTTLTFFIFTNLCVQIQGSSPNPIISYCTSETNDVSLLAQSEFIFVSNSTFEFGEIDRNVIQLNSKLEPQFLFVKCEAPYPIRWLAPKPL
ncbi:unnamed protein product, partial [Allacma fusca]